jgi:hypothetical protein
MSLYFVQKVLYQLNRDELLRERFANAPASVLGDFELTEEERGALLNADIGLLYVLGVNGQILMHFAAANGIPWDDYLQRMREGLETHGPVRAGVYATTGYQGIEAHDAALAEQRGGNS